MSGLGKAFKYINAEGGSLSFTYAEGFLISKPTGIDTVSVALSQATGIDQVGATVKSKNIQPRPIVISGQLVGKWQAENKTRLLDIIRPDIPGKLYCDDWYVNVAVTESPNVEALKNHAGFSFSLLAAYPYWIAEKKDSTVLSGVEPLFKFPWNISREYRFGQRIAAQLINIVNRGQVPAPFTVEIQALDTVLNPKITNAGNGKFLHLEKELTAGESVVIEITHSSTYVTSSIDGDIRGALTLDSALNRLEVGDNVLKPEAESGREDMDISVTFAAEKVGVAL